MYIETATNAKTNFGKMLQHAIKEPVIIEKSGRNVAAIISFEEYERLEALEDAYWVKRAEEAEKEGFAGPEESAAILKRFLNVKN